MKITYYGHSNFLISNDEVSILIDPFFTGNPFQEDKDNVNTVKPDIIVVTHAHGDHLGDSVGISERTGAEVVSNFEISNFMQEKGVNTHPLHIGGKKKYEWGFIKLVPAFHGSSFPDGSYGGTAAGVLIQLEDRILFHAGDSALSYEFKMLGETNRIFLSMLPVGDNFTMDAEDAGKAAEYLRTKVVIPMHYNTFDVISVSEDELEYPFRHFRLEVMEPDESREF